MNRKIRKSNLSKLVLIDQYPSVDARLQAASKLARVFGKDNQTWLSLLSKERYVIKEKVGEETAKLWQKKLQTAGIFCRVEKDGAESTKEDLKSITYYPITASASASLKIKEEKVETPYEEIEIEASQKYFSADEEIDEDDEEDALWVAPFSLKNKLEKTHGIIKAPRHLPKHLSIIKSIGSVVSDATHLAPRSTFKIVSKKGSQKLAQFSAKGIGQIFFSEKMKGHIQYADKTKVNLDQYKQDSQFYSRWKKIYRITLPEDANVILFDGDITYSINYAALESLPDVKESIMSNALTWRHWATSFGFHLAMILVAAVIYYFQATTPVNEQLRFVKIDPSLLKQLEMNKVEKPKPKEQPKPKKVEPPPKPEPVKVAEKVEPVKKRVKPQPVQKAKAHKKPTRKLAMTAPPSRHPKAGGGYGKGNTKNRDIKQTGLLSLLGNSNIAGPSNAIASVTNLDAVPSPGATAKNFKVGGNIGSLGTGKISVSNDSIIQTKGTTQVLRSAGASGPGQVAALEKGKTGKKQVRAMVTARMTQKVKIQGGMSREAVKRVIDQHLNEITLCYETALMSNPSISGRAIFEWKILMSGNVGEINIVASNINSHEIHECIKAAIKSWRFPKPSGAEVIVSYPFVFDLVAF